jgi:hypothetical protein
MAYEAPEGVPKIHEELLGGATRKEDVHPTTAQLDKRPQKKQDPILTLL